MGNYYDFIPQKNLGKTRHVKNIRINGSVIIFSQNNSSKHCALKLPVFSVKLQGAKIKVYR